MAVNNKNNILFKNKKLKEKKMIKKFSNHISTTAFLAIVTLANGAGAATTTLTPPAGAQTDLIGFINSLLGYVLAIAGLLAVIFLISSGFKYLTSGGNESNVTSAKNGIMYAIIGLVIIVAAFAIKNYVMRILTGGVYSESL